MTTHDTQEARGGHLSPRQLREDLAHLDATSQLLHILDLQIEETEAALASAAAVGLLGRAFYALYEKLDCHVATRRRLSSTYAEQAHQALAALRGTTIIDDVPAEQASEWFIPPSVDTGNARTNALVRAARSRVLEALDADESLGDHSQTSWEETESDHIDAAAELAWHLPDHLRRYGAAVHALVRTER